MCLLYPKRLCRTKLQPFHWLSITEPVPIWKPVAVILHTTAHLVRHSCPEATRGNVCESQHICSQDLYHLTKSKTSGGSSRKDSQSRKSYAAVTLFCLTSGSSSFKNLCNNLSRFDRLSGEVGVSIVPAAAGTNVAPGAMSPRSCRSAIAPTAPSDDATFANRNNAVHCGLPIHENKYEQA